MWPTPAPVSRTAPSTAPVETGANTAACRSAWLWACLETVRMWGQVPRVPALSRGHPASCQSELACRNTLPGASGRSSTHSPLPHLFEGPQGSSGSQPQALLLKTFTSILLLLSPPPLMNSLHSAFSWPRSHIVTSCPVLSCPALSPEFSSISSPSRTLSNHPRTQDCGWERHQSWPENDPEGWGMECGVPRVLSTLLTHHPHRRRSPGWWWGVGGDEVRRSQKEPVSTFQCSK